jgi:hypothetical protein
VVYIFDLTIGEVETGGYLSLRPASVNVWVPGQTGLQSSRVARATQKNCLEKKQHSSPSIPQKKSKKKKKKKKKKKTELKKYTEVRHGNYKAWTTWN